MADFQQQLQAILSDPEAMSRITALAGALTGSGQEAESSQEVSVQEAETPLSEAANQPQAPGPSVLFSPLGGPDQPDPALLNTVMALFSEYNVPNSETTALLEALKPFLNEPRREKLAQAERAARLSKVAQAALRLWREGQLHV